MTLVSVIVLAGGHSARMGRNKALEMIGGRTLLRRVLDAVGPLTDEVLLVTAKRQQDASWLPSGRGIRHVVDALPGEGPLVGVCSGLLAARHPLCIAVACDMPFLNAALLRHMTGLARTHDAVVPRVAGKAQALHAVYSRSCIGPMRAALEQGKRSLRDALDTLDVRWFDTSEMQRYDPRLLSCFSVNTPEDLERAKEIALTDAVAPRAKDWR